MVVTPKKYIEKYVEDAGIDSAKVDMQELVLNLMQIGYTLGINNCGISELKKAIKEKSFGLGTKNARRN